MPALEDELGDIISKARSGLGLSTRQLAAATGLSEHETDQIESYRLIPDRPVLTALANSLSLEPEKLIGIADGWAPAPLQFSSDRMTLNIVPVSYGGYGENCYIVASAQTRAAAVIDPGGAADKIIGQLDASGLRLELVLITHAHGDHVGALARLIASKPDARIVSHPLERGSFAPPARWEPAGDGAMMHLGELDVTALHTPGHTRGSTCYAVNGVCLVGDTLFAGSIGRPASPTAYRPMLSAIRSKLLSLPDSTILLPGHGPATTVGEENARNPFFRPGRPVPNP